MEISVGDVLPGKVTGITKYGAFVSLPDNKMGMVHISEISHTYVNDIREHLTEGQEVSVKIISLDPEGRANLSIKKTQEPPPAPIKKLDKKPGNARAHIPPESMTFEDKLKRFMADSESKISDLKHHGDRKGTRKGRR